MKRYIFLFLFVIASFNFCLAQEWFTSFDVAKRLALIQNKMLFVMWEDTFNYQYPIEFNIDRGVIIETDLFADKRINRLIWEYFIPVKLPESNYAEISYQIKETRGLKYYNKLIDDSIKIMDVNGNILNINTSNEYLENLSEIVDKYALNTSFLKQELSNFSKDKNETTAFSLASKYLDFAIFASKDIRLELILLAHIYFDEAKKYLPESKLIDKKGFLQRNDLLVIQGYLILDKPRKALRHLRKIGETEIYKRNQSLFSFLNYTAYKLIRNKEKSELWKSEISAVDLKKTKLILNINL